MKYFILWCIPVLVCLGVLSGFSYTVVYAEDAEVDCHTTMDGCPEDYETTQSGISNLHNSSSNSNTAPATGQGQTTVTNNSAQQAAQMDFDNGIVVCGRADLIEKGSMSNAEYAKKIAQSCNFQAFVTFINRLVQYAIILATLLMVGMIAYTGWEYLNAGDKPATLANLKGRLTSIVIGIIILLGSWLFFTTIADTVLTEGYKAYIYLIN